MCSILPLIHLIQVFNTQAHIKPTQMHVYMHENTWLYTHTSVLHICAKSILTEADKRPSSNSQTFSHLKHVYTYKHIVAQTQAGVHANLMHIDHKLQSHRMALTRKWPCKSSFCHFLTTSSVWFLLPVSALGGSQEVPMSLTAKFQSPLTPEGQKLFQLPAGQPSLMCPACPAYMWHEQITRGPVSSPG